MIAPGVQDFEKLRMSGSFYVDKTDFIREWWKGCDAVTLIARPLGFGKTLNMSMLNCFFSNQYAGRSDLFEGLKVWEDPAMREEQGKWPVIFPSFADVKGSTYAIAMKQIKTALVKAFYAHAELYQTDIFLRNEQEALNRISVDMDDIDAAMSLHMISRLLEKIHGKKVLIFLDEYDTPFQEAYMNGYLDELLAFSTSMFVDAFKANRSLERGILTGITRVNDPGFSDLNNLVLVTTTSDEYATAFGFTEEEVFGALEQQGFGEAEKQEVKDWYDGLAFGSVKDIYNSWSVTNFWIRANRTLTRRTPAATGWSGSCCAPGIRRPKVSLKFCLKAGT